MTIYYSDELGEVGVDIDSRNICFCNGEVYFDSNGEEYRININSIIEIIN